MTRSFYELLHTLDQERKTRKVHLFATDGSLDLSWGIHWHNATGTTGFVSSPNEGWFIQNAAGTSRQGYISYSNLNRAYDFDNAGFEAEFRKQDPGSPQVGNGGGISVGFSVQGVVPPGNHFIFISEGTVTQGAQYNLRTADGSTNTFQGSGIPNDELWRRGKFGLGASSADWYIDGQFIGTKSDRLPASRLQPYGRCFNSSTNTGQWQLRLRFLEAWTP